MEENKLTLEDYTRYFKVVGNPQRMAIVIILYAAKKLEEMKTERTYESWRHFSEMDMERKREAEVGNYYLTICRTCKMVEWTFDHELAEYREEHKSHDFISLEPGSSDRNDRVIEWLVQFLGWPMKEES